MKPLKMQQRPRVAIYIRVSTWDQAKEGYSLSAQRERLTKYAEARDWDIYDFYVDEGKSAKDTNREELQRLLTDLPNNKFNIVLFFKLDRFTRSVRDLYEMWNTFQEHEVDFHSATEPIDTTTPIGRALMGLLGIFAQLERETTAERVAENMEHMVKEGNWHGGAAPFGYEWTGEELIIKEDEASQVLKIFEQYINGLGELKLAAWMQEHSKRLDGKDWNDNQMNYILQNPLYTGSLRWNVGKENYFIVENSVPAIVSKKLFDQALAVRKARSGMHPRQASSTYVFSGRLKCIRCGSPMRGMTMDTKSATRAPRPYYECTERRRKRCDLPYIPGPLIEEHFLEYLDAWSSPKAAIAAAKDTIVEAADNTKEIKRIEQELNKIKIRRKNYLKALGNEDMTQEEYRELTEEDRVLEGELKSKLELLQGPIEEIPAIEQIAEMVANIRIQWQYMEPIQRKTLLQIVTKSIYVDYDKVKKECRFELEY